MINGGKIFDKKNFWYSWAVIDIRDKNMALKVLEEKMTKNTKAVSSAHYVDIF